MDYRTVRKKRREKRPPKMYQCGGGRADRSTMANKSNKPIFFDASGRRATHIAIFGWVAAVIAMIAGAAFFASLATTQRLDSVKLTGQMNPVPVAELERTAMSPGLLRSAARLATEARERREKLVRERARRAEHAARTHSRAAIL
jgi:hypothetical protein